MFLRAACASPLHSQGSSEREPSPPQFTSPKSRTGTKDAKQNSEKARQVGRIDADKGVLKTKQQLVEDCEVFCVRFSPDSKYVAAGCGDGSVRIFNPEGKLSYLLNAGASDSLPTTAIRFRPSASSSRSKNMLLTGNANGMIEHWHMTSRKRIFKTEEEDNQIYALDYCSTGDMFASAGKDTIVRVYEEATKSLLVKFERSILSGVNATSGHSNRVYAVKFHPTENNLLCSAGWDNTVQVWDIRVKKAVRYIYGPHICGDSLDLFGDKILTGGWESKNALKLWDFKSGKLISTIPFRQSTAKQDAAPEMLYTACFSPDGKMVAAGGSGGPEARIFDVTKPEFTLVDSFNAGGDSVFSAAFAPDAKKLATACGSSEIAILDMRS